MVLICTWENLKTFVTADFPVFGPLIEDTIELQDISTTESITIQIEDWEDPSEINYEANTIAI